MIEAREIRTLMSERGAPRVSLYLQTHVAGPEINKDPIRFQNLLRDAERDLEAQDVPPEAATRLLAPGRELVEDRSFWRHQDRGLAAFLADGDLRTYRLPAPFTPLWTTGDRFHLKPLLPHLLGGAAFHVLALDLEGARLLRASDGGVEPVDLGDTPTRLVEAVGGDYRDKSLQHHAGGAGSGSGTPAMFHGQGSGKDDNKVEVRKFLHRLDEGVARATGKAAPLVLTGVEYVVSIYRAVTDHPHVHEQAIEGSPARLSDEQLLEKAREIVAAPAEGSRDAAAREFAARRATDAARTDDGLESVVLRAIDGQVETLFVPADRECWGRLDAGARRVAVHDPREAGDEDLYDRAGVETAERGGVVHVVPRDEVPGDGPVAAILRYPG